MKKRFVVIVIFLLAYGCEVNISKTGEAFGNWEVMNLDNIEQWIAEKVGTASVENKEELRVDALVVWGEPILCYRNEECPNYCANDPDHPEREIILRSRCEGEYQGEDICIEGNIHNPEHVVEECTYRARDKCVKGTCVMPDNTCREDSDCIGYYFNLCASTEKLSLNFDSQYPSKYCNGNTCVQDPTDLVLNCTYAPQTTFKGDTILGPTIYKESVYKRKYAECYRMGDRIAFGDVCRGPEEFTAEPTPEPTATGGALADDDFDGVPNEDDDYPNDPTRAYTRIRDDDGDGIPNYLEDKNQNGEVDRYDETDPHNPDTDGDGIRDGGPMGEDKNSDGVVNAGETDPRYWDSDGDGHHDNDDDYPLDKTRWDQCGNGIVVPPEECDDGNRNNNDDCLYNCKNATCGDTYVWNQQNGNEECDDGMNCVLGQQCFEKSEENAHCALFTSDSSCKPRTGFGNHPAYPCDENCKNEPKPWATPTPTASQFLSCSPGQIQYYCASVPDQQGLHIYRRVCLSSGTWGTGIYWNYCSNGCSQGKCIPDPSPTPTPS